MPYFHPPPRPVMRSAVARPFSWGELLLPRGRSQPQCRDKPTHASLRKGRAGVVRFRVKTAPATFTASHPVPRRYRAGSEWTGRALRSLGPLRMAGQRAASAGEPGIYLTDRSAPLRGGGGMEGRGVSGWSCRPREGLLSRGITPLASPGGGQGAAGGRGPPPALPLLPPAAPPRARRCRTGVGCLLCHGGGCGGGTGAPGGGGGEGLGRGRGGRRGLEEPPRSAAVPGRERGGGPGRAERSGSAALVVLFSLPAQPEGGT